MRYFCTRRLRPVSQQNHNLRPSTLPVYAKWGARSPPDGPKMFAAICLVRATERVTEPQLRRASYNLRNERPHRHQQLALDSLRKNLGKIVN